MVESRTPNRKVVSSSLGPAEILVNVQRSLYTQYHDEVPLSKDPQMLPGSRSINVPCAGCVLTVCVCSRCVCSRCVCVFTVCVCVCVCSLLCVSVLLDGLM